MSTKLFQDSDSDPIESSDNDFIDDQKHNLLITKISKRHNLKSTISNKQNSSQQQFNKNQFNKNQFNKNQFNKQLNNKLQNEPKQRNHLNIVHDKKISLTDLANNTKDQNFKKKINLASETLNEKNQRLQPAPDEFSINLKRRSNCYKKAQRSVSKWNKIVRRNRESSQLDFSRKQTVVFEKTSLNQIGARHLNQLTNQLTDFDKIFDRMLQSVKVNEVVGKDEVKGCCKEVENLSKNSSKNSSKNLFKNGDKNGKLNDKIEEENLKKKLAEKAKKKSNDFHRAIEFKRKKKIKSKKYRKALKIERNKEKMKLEKEGLGVEEDKNDVLAKHAEERMNLRHKNTGKWAKRVSRRPFLMKDKEIKSSLNDMNQIHQTLKRKAKQQNDSENEEENLFDEKSDLEEDLKSKTVKKGIFALNFMKKALENKNEIDKKFVNFSGDKEEEIKEDFSGVKFSQNCGSKNDNFDDKKSVKFSQNCGSKDDNFDGKKSVKFSQNCGSKEKLKFSQNSEQKGETKVERKAESKAKFYAKNKNWLFDAEFYSESEESFSSGESDDNENENMSLKGFATSGVDKRDFIEENNKDENESTNKMKMNGWGSWAGLGTTKKSNNQKQPKAKKIKPLFKTNLIINKKAVIENRTKVSISDKPKNFKSVKEYNKSVGEAVGFQWNNEFDFVQKIKPNLALKKGIIIEPIAFGDSLGRS